MTRAFGAQPVCQVRRDKRSRAAPSGHWLGHCPGRLRRGDHPGRGQTLQHPVPGLPELALEVEPGDLLQQLAGAVDAGPGGLFVTAGEDGYPVVEEAADDVLLLRPAIVNLDVAAPETSRMSRGRSYVDSAGQMTLYIELYDSVTELPNRRVFTQHLRQVLREMNPQDHKLGILLIDLDHFKEVNDTFGYAVGDFLLQSVAGRLVEVLVDLIAPLPGQDLVVGQGGQAGDLYRHPRLAETRGAFDEPLQRQGRRRGGAVRRR